VFKDIGPPLVSSICCFTSFVLDDYQVALLEDECRYLIRKKTQYRLESKVTCAEV
jgi:hypothetical protein